MKIIQSFWTKPAYHNSDDTNARFNGGWPNQKNAFYSFALSALTIDKFYSQNELYTDQRGKELFHDLLELPYSKIHTKLDSLNDYNPKLWALGKLVACADQKEPFIHLDNDIFIWDKVSYEIDNYDIIAQNVEEDFPNYSKAFGYMLTNFESIPQELIHSFYKNGKILAHNAGFIGGKNFDFFQELKNKAFNLIETNTHHLKNLDIGIFNTIFEQQLGHALTENKNLKVQYLFEEVAPNFAEIIDFSSVPVSSKYIHCIGYAKKSVFACEQIEARLSYHFPEYYKHLNKKLQKHFGNQYFTTQISEKRLKYIHDFYSFVDRTSIDELWNTKFKINENCVIDFESDPITVAYTIPHDQQLHKKELEGWDAILLYFLEPVSMKELYDELSQDKALMKQFQGDLSKFKNKIMSFVLEKTLLIEILHPVTL
ncbi:DUF6734 family protein [Aquimarina sp. 2304DJ70-9]|uniref:DUF6734 family protein n=1 Tax=Aquimarina penaris TaxID=3231044 RepID=UPI00346244DA